MQSMIYRAPKQAACDLPRCFRDPSAIGLRPFRDRPETGPLGPGSEKPTNCSQNRRHVTRQAANVQKCDFDDPSMVFAWFSLPRTPPNRTIWSPKCSQMAPERLPTTPKCPSMGSIFKLECNIRHSTSYKCQKV